MTTSATDFTERERNIMAFAWQCFEADPKARVSSSPPLSPLLSPFACPNAPRSNPQVDYKKLAALCGMTNPQSASNAWSRIRKKLHVQAAEAGDAGVGASPAGTPKATPKATPRKRKNGAQVEAGDAEETPTKKGKKVKADADGEGVKREDSGAEAEVEAEAENGEVVKREEMEEGGVE